VATGTGSEIAGHRKLCTGMSYQIVCVCVCVCVTSVTQESNLGLWYLIVKVSRSRTHTYTHTHTHTHTQQDCSEWVTISSQRPLTTQHTTDTRNEHPCPQRDLNPRSQQSRHTPQTARPPGSTSCIITNL